MIPAKLLLLMRARRPNLFLNAGDFTQASWTKGGATIAATNIVAPDGTSTASFLREDGTTGTHQIFQTVVVSPVQMISHSCWVKSAGRTKITFGGNWMFSAVLIDLSAGSVTGAEAAKIAVRDAGSGWWRVSATDTVPDTTGRTYVLRLHNGTTDSYAGDGASGVYIWRPKLEIGTCPSAWIA